MRILLKNARILTMEEGKGIFLGNIAVNGGKIEEVSAEMPKGEFDETIDCEGNLLMPTFKNAHTHSAMPFLRNVGGGKNLHDWLFDTVFPAEARLMKDDQYHLAKMEMIEYIEGGIGACFDMYFSAEENIRAAVDMGVRLVYCGTVEGDVKCIPIMKEEHKRFNDYHPLISYRLGYHAEYTAKEEVLKGLSKIAHELKAPVYGHNSETESEVEGCKERHNGLTPTEYADSLGLFDYGGGGFHCIHLSENDRRIFKEKGLYIVSNPGSNSKLASGICPLREYDEMGLNLALGTDGASSNNAIDMFYEMRLAAVEQKLLYKDPSAFKTRRILEMATVGGAKAMGLNNALYLAKGQDADIIMIDLHRVEMLPLNDIEESLVYSCSKSCLKMTMVAGRILYMDGKHRRDDIGEIIEKALLISERIHSGE